MKNPDVSTQIKEGLRAAEAAPRYQNVSLVGIVKIPPRLIERMAGHQRAWKLAYDRLLAHVEACRAAKQRVALAVHEGKPISQEDARTARDKEFQRSQRRSAKNAMKLAVEAAKPTASELYRLAIEAAEAHLADIFEREKLAAQSVGIDVVPSRTAHLLLCKIESLKAAAQASVHVVGASPRHLTASIVDLPDQP